MPSGVEFEEDKFSYKPPGQVSTGFSARPSFTPASGGQVMINRNDPKMVQWLMRNGFAKSPAAAQGILVFVILLNAVITYFVIQYIL